MKIKHPPLQWQRLPGHRNLKGRAGHTATLVGKQIFVLGGRNGNEFFNDLWAFDTEIEKWALLQQKVPFPSRAYHTATLVADHYLWVIGGSDPYTMYNDLHVLDTISLKWSSPVASGHLANKRRGTHAAVLHPLQNKSILIYGGYGGAESCWMSDLSILHTDTLEWEELQPKGTRPAGRGYHTLTVFGTCVALFGGKSEGGILREDNISIYDAVSNTWITPAVEGEIPSPRSNHAAALFEENLIVIHGGRYGRQRLSDMFVLQIAPVVTGLSNVIVHWHLIEKTKNLPDEKKTIRKGGPEITKIISPGGRSAHSLVVKGNSLYIFGGYGGSGLTFDDMFLLRMLPKITELEYPKQPYVEEVNGLTLIDVEEETDEEIQEGWRSTKRPRSKSLGPLTEAAGPVKVQQEQVDMSFVEKKRVHEGSDTRSTEPMAEVCPTLNAQIGKMFTCLEDRSLAIMARENGLYQKEVNSLQKALGTREDIVKEKTLIETELRASKAQLEQEQQRLQVAIVNLQEQLKVKDGKIITGNQKVRDLGVHVESLKADIQVLRLELEEKEKERQVTFLKARTSEQRSDDLARSLQEAKATAAESIHEKDQYKICVQKLETELEKQMQALQQASLKYETEKAFLLKEIAERKGTADRLLVELGIFKESTRVQEETICHQAKQIERGDARVETLQKEKEDLNRTNAIMATECRQLAAAKERAEAECELARSELQTARSMTDQREAENLRLKETADQTREHISSLHASLKKDEEIKRSQLEEIERLRVLIHDTEEFQRAQAKSLQIHAEKLQCARQSCPY